MSKLKEFTTQAARPLPVVVLADVSGSMGVDGKIQALNLAVREMIDRVQDEDRTSAPRSTSRVITFGGKAQRAPAAGPRSSRTRLVDRPRCERRDADGGRIRAGARSSSRTAANTVPSRAYRPTIVLVSDGQPTDPVEVEPLDALLKSERGGKAFRMALAIGADADHAVLQEHSSPTPRRACTAPTRPGRSGKFFQLVTMSVSARSRSANPNVAAPAA
jgi:uncharacterized protein YegL